MASLGDPLVLVADDDPDIREAVRMALEGILNLRSVEASDGKEALRQVRIAQPSLVILDMALPKLDGLEVARRLKGNPETSHIPILVLSGLRGAPQRALALGCEGYVAKPFNMNDLLTKVAAILRQNE